jgi:thioesterase domain-containing protein
MNEAVPLASIVQHIAEQHVQDLQRQQPTGPYHLIGHSSGGRVAFEMAYQLEQQGEQVAFLAVLDTYAPALDIRENPMAHYTEYNWLYDIVRTFETVARGDLQISLQDLEALSPDHAYEHVMQVLQQHNLFAPATKTEELKILVNNYRMSCLGFFEYTMPGKVHCPIHLFYAGEPTEGEEEDFEEGRVTWCWSDCTYAEITEDWVSGTHLSMIVSPNAETLAQKLGQYLISIDKTGRNNAC